MKHFTIDHPETGVTQACQVAVIGDRLFTDVMMANMMGAWAVWVRDGVIVDGTNATGPWERPSGIWPAIETRLAAFLTRRGFTAPVPSSSGGKE